MGRPLREDEARRLPPLVLAYVGDAVYELYVRSRLAGTGGGARRLHAEGVRRVSAPGQERVWHVLERELSDVEAEVARRGRNAKANVPQHVDPATYRRSTALEAVLGYLYLTGREERIVSLLDGAFAAVFASVETNEHEAGDPS